MESKNRVNRRAFMRSTGLAMVGGGILSGGRMSGPEEVTQIPEARVREYRTLGRTGFKVSDIGFGTGNFNNANVLQVALDRGINYIDTAEHYVNGQAETAVGQALKNRDRKSIFLTTKLNVQMGGSTPVDLRRRFFRCLERLQTDYVDCLMIHQTPRIEQVGHEDFHRTFQELKAEGKVRFLGLSNHGTEQSWWGPMDVRMEDVLGAAVEDGRFDVALFVYNFLQKEQGEQIIRMCQSRNMGVTLMKTDPINLYASIRESVEQTEQRGRRLSESRQKIARDYEAYVARAEAFKQQYGIRSEAEARAAAIKFVLTHPGVHSVCPSINTFEELETFVGLSGGRLSDGENRLLDGYGEMLGSYYCRHACGICEPACPERVPVNTVLRYNHYFEAHGREKQAMEKYARLGSAGLSACLDCPGYCETNCPHGVPVRNLLARAQTNLTLA